ncbi:DUF6261 family protein [Aquimarina longa]|uniref:DUF6261 family protein n=1 Tax=Aquimarina longa TaxID=1080221 RepID=UPI000781406A|nr:DUF6261 family protein [Aquimarina longa]
MNTLLVLPQLQKFKNGEFSKYIRTVIELGEEQDMERLDLELYAAKLKEAYTNFRTVYKKNRGSLLTPEMVMYDRYRDNGLKLFQRSIKLIADFARKEEDRNRASRIYRVISKHGKAIYDMAYNQQGGIMDEIIEEIEGDDILLTTVENLGQRQSFLEMKEAHTNFDIMFKERVKEQQREQTKLNLRDLRGYTQDAYRELFDWIFINAKTKGIEQFETYIGNLNTLTEQYNLSVERRLNNGRNISEELDDDFDQNQGE